MATSTKNITKNVKININKEKDCNACESRRLCVVKLQRIKISRPFMNNIQANDQQAYSFNNKQKTIERIITSTKAPEVLRHQCHKLKKLKVRVKRVKIIKPQKLRKSIAAIDYAANYCKGNTVLAANTNEKMVETQNETCGLTRIRTRSQVKHLKLDGMEFVITPEKRNELKKLSLSRAFLRNSLPVKEHRFSHFEPRKNSTISNRNAKHKQNDNLDKRNELKTQIVGKTEKKPPKNLANKVEVIEQILFSDEEAEIENPETIEKKTISLPPKAENKAKRFFHRNDIEFKKPDLQQTKKLNNKKQPSTFHPKTSVDKVYEFLSSQSDSDSANKGDPAADVIKRLIDEGKVRVAKTRKGTGKHVLKRKKKEKLTTKQVKKNKKQQKVAEKANVKTNIPTFVEENIDDNFNDHDKEFIEPCDVGAEVIEGQQLSVAPHVVRQNKKHSFNGTFSHLARSVLLNQTEKNDSKQKMITEQRKLLEIARKFVSTPVNRKVPPPTHLSNLSPIPMTVHSANDNQLGNVSPWRLDEDAHLPSVFHFSKNSSNLPSFSSDYIPSTPKKNKFKYHMLDSLLEPLDNIPSEIQHKSPPSLSSFSSNDSNAENLSPPRSASGALDADVIENADVNADVFNLRQHPNPRRTYSHRSPLKSINILEVVTLPPWKKPENLNYQNLIQETNKCENNTEKKVKSSKLDLFGFEEFIDDSDTEEQTMEEQTNAAMHPNSTHLGNQTLRDKLHNLSKWRPDIENQINMQPNSKPINRVFDNDAGAPRQRNIKKMLCSTMVNPSPYLRSNVQNLDNGNSDSDEQLVNRKKKSNAMMDIDLFKDPEPQLSFDEKNPHRTYVRPYKKQRKLRHNFVMFLDSDESGEENESDGEDHSRDHESIFEKKTEHKKKRKKKIEKPDPNFNSFVDNFNSMCKEVDQYELVVE